MRTRMRNQFPRRREIHVDDVVDARARSLVTVTDADARARATIVVDANSTRVVARRRHGGVEWNPSSRARADARDRRPRARVLESLLDESRDESRAGRDTRRDRPPIAVGKGKNTRGDSWTGHDRWRWSSSRPSRRRHRRGTGDRARGLTSSTRGSWRGRDPSMESIDRDETHARKKAHRVDRVDRFHRSSRSVGGMAPLGRVRCGRDDG